MFTGLLGPSCINDPARFSFFRGVKAKKQNGVKNRPRHYVKSTAKEKPIIRNTVFLKLLCKQ
jgi:hypothetical protein